MERSALIDGPYRYRLWRRWAPGPEVLFVMLNPSTADHQQDDPTLRRCIGFATAWGFGALHVCNLFAWRATEPRELRRVSDPVGPENDRYLRAAAGCADRVVVAWGNHGALFGRGDQVLAWLPAPECLGLTKAAQPRHPLYVRKDTALVSALPAVETPPDLGLRAT